MPESTVEPGSKSEKTLFKNFSKEQKLVLLSLSFAYLSRCASMGLLAPNFPTEGAKHGISSSVIGIVFSVGSVVSLIASPIMGVLIATFGPKIILIAGISLNGIFAILFGCLELIDSKEWFVAGSFTCMGFLKLGGSAFGTAILTYAAHLFPSNMNFVIGALETLIAIGEAIGLASGGVLHDLGGFKLPLILFGGLHLLSLPLNLYLLPTDKDCNVNIDEVAFQLRTKKVSDGKASTTEVVNDTENITVKDSDEGQGGHESLFLKNGKKIPTKLRLWHLAVIPGTAIMAILIVVTDIWWSFLESTLEPHLAPLKLTTTEKNLMFLLISVLWGLVTPICGWLADWMDRTWILMSFGLCAGGITFFFLGPVPFLGLQNTVWLNIVCLTISTVTQAAALIPAFEAVLHYTLEAGHKDNIATYAIVSSLITTMFSVGGIIGSFSGGFLLDNFGYPTSAGICGTICFFYGVLVASYFLCCHKESSRISRNRMSIRSTATE